MFLILTQSGKAFKRLSNLPEMVQSQEVKEPRFYCRISLARAEGSPYPECRIPIPMFPQSRDSNRPCTPHLLGHAGSTLSPPRE